ncbi:MAG: hypothetical protein HUU50_04200 [Candidatus Brocadiae bacterium]|nr:hypothetical protein [Candidatus Brocadiia bacterium]
MQKNIIILFFIFLFPLSSIFSQFYTNRTEQELENYSKVAKILAYEFYTDETAPEKYNFAQSLAKMYESQQILQCLDSTDNQLSSLVNKTNSAITEIINSILNLKKLPMPPGELAQNIEAIIRGLIWDFRGGLKRNEEIQKQKDAILKEIHSLVDSVNKLQAYQILLPAIANKHQTTAKNKSNSLSIDFSEPWQCWGYGEKNDKDVLFLKNISGQELSKCTILVKIYGENAEVIQTECSLY